MRTQHGDERERETDTRFSTRTQIIDSRGRPLTRLRRSVTLLRPLSGTYAHAHVLEMAFTDTHVSLSLFLFFSRISIFLSGSSTLGSGLSFSSLSVSLWGDAPIASGLYVEESTTRAFYGRPLERETIV